MAVPSDAELAQLACVAIYSPTVATDGVFEHIDTGPDDGVFWGLYRGDGFDVPTFRGSHEMLDWRRDARAQPMLSRIGTVHSGFYAGLEKCWAEMRPLIKQPVYLTGHSLGASRATQMTAIMVVDKMPPVARVVFGEPKAGFADLAAIVNTVPGRSYRNSYAVFHDEITDEALIPLDYIHPTPPISIPCEPTGNLLARFGFFALHHGPVYKAAMDALALTTKGES